MRKLTNSEISKKRITLETLSEAKKFPVVVVLDNIRSMYNVGSIFRTSDAFMIEKLYLTGYTPAPPKKEVLKTALGSTESVCWEYVKNPVELIKELKSKNYNIIALEITDCSSDIAEIEKFDYPLALVVGNEITGVQNEILNYCAQSVEIGMYGIKHSLNVAVAYGIAIYELRKRYFNNK